MTKQVRWKCPLCNSGLLAPSRPRKNDVRRYCLSCSGDTGKLVERVAPSLDKQRAVVKEKKQVKEKAKRQKRANARLTNRQEETKTKQRQAIFDKEAERIWKLLEPFHYNLRKCPNVTIITARQNRSASGVHYFGYNEVRIRILKEHESENFIRDWVVLAHELCHAAINRSVHAEEGKHGRTFYKMLRHVAERRWKVTTDGWHELNARTSNSKSWGYQCDYIIEASLRKQDVVTFKYPRPTKPITK